MCGVSGVHTFGATLPYYSVLLAADGTCDRRKMVPDGPGLNNVIHETKSTLSLLALSACIV